MDIGNGGIGLSIIVDHVFFQHKDCVNTEEYALNDINLEIKEGEFVGIIGQTGSGKSTLIQHLNGLEKATRGRIYYNGEDIYAKDYPLKQLRGKVGLVFQYPEYQLFENTVIEDVKFGPRNLGLSSLEVDVRSYQALKDVGLGEELLDVSPFQLSGGQKRRVAIAGVLAMEPEVLILDEPTAGLDPYGREEILTLISRLHKEKACTIVLVSHSMEDVANYVERLLVMYQGSILLDGSPREIFRHRAELEEIGLSVPQVTKVMQELREKGLSVNGDAISVDEAKREILRAYNGRGKGKMV